MRKNTMLMWLLVSIFTLSLMKFGGGIVNAEHDKPRGGQLIIASQGQPPTLDPVMSTTVLAADISKHMFEPLVAFDQRLNVVPVLAESYSVSEDGKVYTFYLRKGVKFHNGKEMIAEDVIASMERWLKHATSAKTVIQEADFVEVDRYTVEMHVAKPSALIPQALCIVVQPPAIMPKDVIDNAGPLGVAEYIGTGPYKYGEWRQDQFISLVRNEEYQPVNSNVGGLAGRKEAYVDEIRWEYVPDLSTHMAGIQTGLFDIVSIPPDSYEWVKNDDSLRFMEVDYNMSHVILLNKNRGIMENPLARKAVQTVIDNEELMLGSIIINFKKESSYMMEAVETWYSTAGSEHYDLMDPVKAKQLLDESGYRGEELILVTTRDMEFAYNSTVILQQQLKQIGIESRIEVFDWATLNEKIFDPKTWDLYSIACPIVATPLDIIYFSEGFFTGPLDEKSRGFLNEIQSSLTYEEAKQYWDEMQEYSLAEFVPYIKVGDFSGALGAHTDKIGGLYGFLGGGVYWNVYKESN